MEFPAELLQFFTESLLNHSRSANGSFSLIENVLFLMDLIEETAAGTYVTFPSLHRQICSSIFNEQKNGTPVLKLPAGSERGPSPQNDQRRTLCFSKP